MIQPRDSLLSSFQMILRFESVQQSYNEWPKRQVVDKLGKEILMLLQSLIDTW